MQTFEPEMLSDLQWNLLRILAKHGAMKRDDLCRSVVYAKKQSAVPRTTIYDNLTRLQYMNLTTKYSKGLSYGSRGRPTVYFKLTEAGSKVLHEREGI